jgi:PAS domain S-box-containing protein
LDRNKELIIKALLKSINSELYIKDINNNYVAVTDSFLENRGLPLNYSVKGKTDKDFYPLKEAEKNTKQDVSVIRTGKPLKETEDYIPGTRKKRWGVIAKIPIFDSDNSVMGIVGVFFDITERKVHEDIRELLEINVNSISDSLVIRDCKTGKYIYINPAAEEQFGYPAKRFLNGGIKFWLDTCIHQEERELHYKYFTSRQWPARREYRIILPDGSVKWLEGSISFQHYKGTECFVAVNRDITERKISENIRTLMEMALKDSSQYILWLLERPPSLKAVYVSESVKIIYGYPPEIFINEQNFWLDHCVHKEDRAKLAEDWFEGIGTYVKQVLFRIVKPDKSIRWIECFSSKIFDNHVVYIEKDVTERVLTINKLESQVYEKIAEKLKKRGIEKDIILEATGIDVCDSV